MGGLRARPRDRAAGRFGARRRGLEIPRGPQAWRRADLPFGRRSARHPCDVFVEYTSPKVAKTNILAALAAGAHVVVGTSRPTDPDYAEIEEAARMHGRAVLACGNFALTAVLLQRFAAMAAKIIPQWEIIDYADESKRDAPSGTVRELASRLGGLAGSRIYSVRLPGYVISAEIIFGMPDQRLSIRHDSGNSARPYVDGALLAIRKVGSLSGLHRGLDAVLDLGA